jgi:hypothetical protein
MLVESWSCRSRDGNILSVLNQNKREHHLSRCLAGLARYYQSEDGRECSTEYLVRAQRSLHEHVRGPLGSRLASGVVDQTSRVYHLHSCDRDSDRKALLSFQIFLLSKEQAHMRVSEKITCYDGDMKVENAPSIKDVEADAGAPPPDPVVPYTVFTKAERRTITWLVGCSMFFSLFTANIYFPCLEELQQAVGVNSSLINLTITTYLIVSESKEPYA